MKIITKNYNMAEEFIWEDIEHKKDADSLDPFTLGRYVQLIIDFALENNESYKLKLISYEKPGRRYSIINYIKTLTLAEIINEAHGIYSRLNNKINGNGAFDFSISFVDLGTDYYYYEEEDEHDKQDEPDKGYIFYIGRCIQFILDNDYENITLDTLINMSPDEIKTEALTKKQEKLLNQNSPFDVNCECDEDCDEHTNGYCRWYYNHHRCECGYRRFYWSGENIANNLDVIDLDGYPDTY